MLGQADAAQAGQPIRPAYGDVELFIGGAWRKGAQGRTLPVLNPATGKAIGNVARAELGDIEDAAQAASRGFAVWRKLSAHDRYTILSKAGDLLRSRADDIATILTMEQGKPLLDATREVTNAASIIDWFAEEGRRAYGRIIPPRTNGAFQMVTKEPIGPVAAFTPWNFPISQAVRKLAAALAAGCSIVLKGAEETPGSISRLVAVFAEAGVPAGVINLLYGEPAEISEYLIAHRVIRKISFTGSTVVGKHLAMLAGKHMKRVTMELGGHSPVIVFEDADADALGSALAKHKYRNAGQVCTSPTRFIVHDSIYDRFTARFIETARAIKVGNGLDDGIDMGPLANARRVNAIEALIADAVEQGANVRAGGKRIDGEGFFFEPTVLTEVPIAARIMNEEPFGPAGTDQPFPNIRGGRGRSQSPRLWARRLRLHQFGQAGRGHRKCHRKRHGLHQPVGFGKPGSPLRGHQGFGVRLGGGHRGPRSLSQYQAHNSVFRLNLPNSFGGESSAGGQPRPSRHLHPSAAIVGRNGLA